LQGEKASVLGAGSVIGEASVMRMRVWPGDVPGCVYGERKEAVCMMFVSFFIIPSRGLTWSLPVGYNQHHGQREWRCQDEFGALRARIV
jgi:hypothetical protein